MFDQIWNVMWSSGNKNPNPRLKSDLVSETLMEELNTRMKEADDATKEKESILKREAGIPDYTWLISDTVKRYKIPNLLRLELEDLTSQIEPDDTRIIIDNFRRSVREDTPVEQIPASFISVLQRHLVTKNLHAIPKEVGNLKVIHDAPEPLGFFKKRSNFNPSRRPDAPSSFRVNSAPASSWRFFRQPKIQPVHFSTDADNNKSDSCNSKDRRANSVPTITSIV